MTAYMTHIWSIDYDSSWVQDVIIRMSQWGLAYFLSLGPFFSRVSSTLLCTLLFGPGITCLEIWISLTFILIQ